MFRYSYFAFEFGEAIDVDRFGNIVFGQGQIPATGKYKIGRDVDQRGIVLFAKFGQVFGTIFIDLAGKVNIIAVSGETPEPSLPSVPTFKQSNLALTGMGWNAFFAPASMPEEKVKLLSSAINKVMQDATVQQTIHAMMLDPVVADLAQSQAMLANFRKQWEPIIKQSGFRAEP